MKINCLAIDTNRWALQQGARGRLYSENTVPEIAGGMPQCC